MREFCVLAASAAKWPPKSSLIFPSVYRSCAKCGLPTGAGAPRRIRVQRCWLSPGRGGQVIFHFADIDSIEAADTLRGLEVQVPIEQRAQLDAGNYFVSDLVGCEVWEAGAASALGSVRDVEFPGSAPLLAVDTNEGEVLSRSPPNFATH